MGKISMTCVIELGCIVSFNFLLFRLLTTADSSFSLSNCLRIQNFVGLVAWSQTCGLGLCVVHAFMPVCVCVCL